MSNRKVILIFLCVSLLIPIIINATNASDLGIGITLVGIIAFPIWFLKSKKDQVPENFSFVFAITITGFYLAFIFMPMVTYWFINSYFPAIDIEGAFGFLLLGIILLAIFPLGPLHIFSTIVSIIYVFKNRSRKNWLALLISILPILIFILWMGLF